MLSGQNFINESVFKFLTADERFLNVKESLSTNEKKLIKEFLGYYVIFDEVTSRTKISTFKDMPKAYKEKTYTDQHIYREKLADIAIQLTPVLLGSTETESN